MTDALTTFAVLIPIAVELEKLIFGPWRDSVD